MNGSKFTDVRSFPRGHRLFHPLTDISIFVTAMQWAGNAYLGGTRPTGPQAARFSCSQFDFAMAIPLGGPFENALNELHAPHIDIGRTVKSRPGFEVDGEGRRIQTSGLSQVSWHIVSAIFLKYFEPYSEWLDDNLGDAVNWPPTLNFCRVVRNSIAHGKIHIRNPSAPSVRWRHLEYGPAENGMAVLGDGLAVGDLLQLMIESSDHLDELSAPTL
jgi:hypothetical protein